MSIQLSLPMGLPPKEELSNLRDLAMPILEIIPCVPSYTEGSSVFILKEAMTEGTDKTPAYTKILNAHGYSITEKCVKYALQSDNFPTDSFTNEYGESILDKLTGGVSRTAADISQMFGAKDMNEAAKNIGEAGKNSESTIGNAISTAMDGAQKSLQGLQNGLGSIGGGSIGNLGGVVSDILGGGQIDFPMLWKGSSFKPSYSATIRLYNPAPGSPTMTDKYIVGPIASLLLLCIPISKKGFTFNWPYIHKIQCKGLFNLQSAFISNVTVIKGGDQHQIGYNQRLGIVDVRIDFGSLYNNIYAMMNNTDINKPTLENYLNSLRNERSVGTLKQPKVPAKNTTKITAAEVTIPTSRVPVKKQEIGENLQNESSNERGSLSTA